MKGYRVFISMERVVMVNQHVKNGITLTDIQRQDLLNNQHGTDGQEESDDTDVARQTKARSSRWTRDQHMTRSRRTKQDISRFEYKTESVSLLSDYKDSETSLRPYKITVIRKLFPKNYGEAIQSNSKAGGPWPSRKS